MERAAERRKAAPVSKKICLIETIVPLLFVF
jgi:hypothetical protein